SRDARHRPVRALGVARALRRARDRPHLLRHLLPALSATTRGAKKSPCATARAHGDGIAKDAVTRRNGTSSEPIGRGAVVVVQPAAPLAVVPVEAGLVGADARRRF